MFFFVAMLALTYTNLLAADSNLAGQLSDVDGDYELDGNPDIFQEFGMPTTDLATLARVLGEGEGEGEGKYQVDSGLPVVTAFPTPTPPMAPVAPVRSNNPTTLPPAVKPPPMPMEDDYYDETDDSNQALAAAVDLASMLPDLGEGEGEDDSGLLVAAAFPTPPPPKVPLTPAPKRAHSFLEPTPKEKTDRGMCKRWCSSNPQSWSVKCGLGPKGTSWNKGACAGCSDCVRTDGDDDYEGETEDFGAAAVNLVSQLLDVGEGEGEGETESDVKTEFHVLADTLADRLCDKLVYDVLKTLPMDTMRSSTQVFRAPTPTVKEKISTSGMCKPWCSLNRQSWSVKCGPGPKGRGWNKGACRGCPECWKADEDVGKGEGEVYKVP